MTKSTKRRAFRVGAGVAALVGLSLAGVGSAQAAPAFDPGATGSRIGGTDRYATAALIAQQAWTSAATVIVANGETNGIDALSASYLAGLKDAPILLTRHDGVPAETAAAIAKLNPSTVIVVGGEPSVSTSTYSALTAGRVGQRIAGTDRYETAAKIVQAGLTTATAGRTTKAVTAAPTTVFVVRGDLYGNQVAADALATSPVAFRAHVPVVLTSTNSLPGSSTALLQTLAPSTVYAVGSDRSVSASVEAELRARLGLSTVPRLQGADRTETAAAIANSPVSKAAGFTGTAVGIANGYSLDALAAGPAAGKAGYPLLLTNSATDVGAGTRAYLDQHKATLTSAKVFGDEKSVSVAVVDEVRSAAGGTDTSKTPPVSVPAPVRTAVAVTDVQTVSVGAYGGDEGGADVFGTFDLGSVDWSTLSIVRVSVDDPTDRTAVHMEAAQDLLESHQFLDVDVPQGVWRYEITTTVGGMTAMAASPARGIEVLAAVPGVGDVSAAQPTVVHGAGSDGRADVVVSYDLGDADPGTLSLQSRWVSEGEVGGWRELDTAIAAPGQFTDVDPDLGERQWRVVARNSQGVVSSSNPSDVREVKGTPQPVTDLDVLGPVAEDGYGLLSAPEVIVNFSSGWPSDPTELTLQRRADGSDSEWTDVHHGSVDEHGGFHDVDVPAGTWVYRILRDNGQGMTAVSDVTAPVTVLPAPDAATGLSATVAAVDEHSDEARPEVTVSFTPGAGDDQLHLQRRLVVGDEPQDWENRDFSSNVTSFTDVDVPAGTWEYRIGTENSQGSTVWSVPVEETVLPAPVGVTDVSIVGEDSDAVAIGFTLGAAARDTLKLQRAQSGNAIEDAAVWSTVGTLGLDDTFIDEGPFDPSTVWRVIAVNSQGAVTASNIVYLQQD
jgi:putative cell wall-binding protein